MVLRLVDVEVGSSLFEAVQKLRTKESATLGPMPTGGFVDAAEAGCLVAAVGGNNELAGYALFRRSRRGYAAIAHLCVDRGSRGKGVARCLFDAVKQRCAACYEIRVTCRRDFAASKMWPKLGFIPFSERPGRGRNGILTNWRCELAPLPLLARLSEVEREDPTVRVALDANVFFAMDENEEGDEASRALGADWLSEFVELTVTEELLNEIHRQADRSRRERQRGRYEQFVHLPRKLGRDEEDRLFGEILSLLAQPPGESADSDARQLALTVSAGVTYFVTRDGALLEAAEKLEDAYGVEVLAPHEVVLRFDRMRHEAEYRPRRLYLGPGTRSVLATDTDIERLAELLHAGHPAPEPRDHTRARLREMLVQRPRYDSVCIEKDGALLAAYVLERQGPTTLDVPFLAVANSELGKTAARHYVESLVARAVREGRTLVRVHNPGRRVGEALAELGFALHDGMWMKLCPRVVAPPAGVAEAVERIASDAPALAPLATEIARELRRERTHTASARADAARMERLLWPAKLLEMSLPCFVAPIEPRWAKELFDHELAEGTLFGADPHLVMKTENVYYRAATPRVLHAPARVLWYVSDDPRFPGTKAIRACSLIEEVLVGPAKSLFGRFRKLGVYQWSNIAKLAGGDPSTPVMAFRFSCTELFRRPVGFKELQEVLRAVTGKGNPIVSPFAIPDDCFVSIYARGTSPDA